MSSNPNTDKQKSVVIVLAACALFIFAGCGGTSHTRGSKQPVHGNHFYFVQLTDTHVGTYDHDERLSKVVKMINNLPVELACVVHSGDVFADNILKPGLADNTKQRLSRVKAPLHILPGNHDILPGNLTATYNAWLEHFGPVNTAAEYKGVVFIFIYTEPYRKDFVLPGVDGLSWLENQLERAGNKPVIIFHHSPTPDDFYHNRMHNTWPAEFKKQWQKLLNSANVKAVIAGHFHRSELHWLGDVPVYVGTATATYWGRQSSFRIYEYTDGKLGFRTEYFDIQAAK